MRKIAASLLLFKFAFSLEVYLYPQYFLWKEFSPAGGKLLEESGFLLGLGLRGDVGYFTGKAELYGGTVDYDGQTQVGDPVQTDTNYIGTSLAGGMWFETGKVIRFRGEALYHFDLWVRDIESTSEAVGYSERWFFDSLDLGLKVSSGELYAFGTYRLMLRDARMQASLEGIPELRPKMGPAYELGVGMKGASYGVELVYSYVKFKRSEPEPYGSGYVLQPESEKQTLSLRLISYF
ncbi:hypothetical protein BCF55_1396 [Hydrogenivirga caldilitoris]|uniref:Outer membrane protein with beta-barrel domain n=1 Tax=Hydrogenivirga caldilitoris TaxID=246264 RepID=A0A497XS46_9AQUI|nr:hypothetical protein [Hydrogenivirga caldilitoris]RLJ71104.1 hypothetical protein BCF55_1396 [Hydrogenivirga caldilitoris]